MIKIEELTSIVTPPFKITASYSELLHYPSILQQSTMDELNDWKLMALYYAREMTRFYKMSAIPREREDV